MDERDPMDETPAANPQSREHRGDQDVERPPDGSALDEHDGRTTEYGAQGAREPAQDEVATKPSTDEVATKPSTAESDRAERG